MAGDTALLIVYCGDHPDDDIIKAADEVLGGWRPLDPSRDLGFSRLCHDMRA